MFELVFSLLVLLFSVIIHEIAHGVVALQLGDPTAKLAGRLTLNPVRHLDPFGSVFLPLLLFIMTQGQGPIIGWARPVPYNPYRLPNPKRAGGLIAVAGPATNLAVAVVFGILLRILGTLPASVLATNLMVFFDIAVSTNIILAVFNLVPIPPLDGSKVLFSLLPLKVSLTTQMLLERYGFFMILIFVFFGFRFILPIAQILYSLITGNGSIW